MLNAFQYAATVVIWGSSWLAIKYQLGVVPEEVSLVYRFGAAALLVLAFCRLTGRPLGFRAADHRFFALQGVLLFGVNYILFYLATGHLTTGLIAVIFSTIVIFNMGFAALFFGRPLEARVVVGAAAGLAGIALVFGPEVAALGADREALVGVGLSVLATAFASLGNMVSLRNQRAGLPVLQTNAFGMAYGAALMAALALVRGQPFIFDTGTAYVGSLAFLAVFASAVAFWTYLSLIGRIGPDRGAYATVVFPVVALLLSTAFEGYTWTPAALAGVVLVAAGNVLVLTRGATGREAVP